LIFRNPGILQIFEYLLKAYSFVSCTKSEPIIDEASPSADDRDFYGFASVQAEDANPSQSDARMHQFLMTRHRISNNCIVTQPLQNYSSTLIQHSHRLHRLNGCLKCLIKNAHFVA